MTTTQLPRRWPLAWRMAFRASAPWFAIISGITILLTMVIPDLRGRGVELVLPLIAGIQAALLFSPDDEPALETLLAAPRPATYLIYERLAAVFVAQGAVGLFGTLVIVLVTGLSPLPIIVGWLPPTLAAIGVGLLVTFVSRRSSAGVLAAIMIVPAMLIGADGLIVRYPELFPLHFFFQPQFAPPYALYFNTQPEVIYMINRVVVTMLGMLAMLRVIMGMRNSEAVLGTNRKTD